MATVNFPPVAEVTRLQIDTVDLWHREPIENRFEGIKRLICTQHEHNYRLWHEEDKARSPTATNDEIANVKRAIDKLNQARNDMIEKVDDALTEVLQQAGVEPNSDAPINTETPGSAIDRLSIMALRMYHLQEQTAREDVDEEHRRSVRAKLLVCQEQCVDLSASLVELLDDIFAGRKRLKVYRQFKMYNDPTLNPYLYNRDRHRAA
jgi:hypothetical protein